MSKAFIDVIGNSLINYCGEYVQVDNSTEHRQIIKNSSDNRHNLYMQSISVLMHCKQLEESILSNNPIQVREDFIALGAIAQRIQNSNLCESLPKVNR